MSAFVASLNSGSNGNCYYVGTHHDAVLIDAGLSCKETEKRMQRLQLSMSKVRAIFISHEHIDHIKGVELISRRYQLPVYVTAATISNTHMRPEHHLVRPFNAHEGIVTGEITVTAFPKLHDAKDPHSFVVDVAGVRIGVFTDIGTPCDHVKAYFSGCHAAFLEANYDDEMLESGRYPYHLKARIRGDHGHMSNAQALALFNEHRPDFMSHVFLSHLSKDNNHPDVALQAFLPHAGNVSVSVASRYNETELFQISPQGTLARQKAVQTALF